MKAKLLQDASRALCTLVLATMVLPCPAADAAYTLDRWYRMGDDPSEGAANNGAVTFTYDSSGVLGQSPSQLADLTAEGSPLYVNISGDRPHANATLDNYAISFDGTTQYLHGPNLNIPAEAERPNHNYTGIEDRGYQLWFKLTATTDSWQHILDDADEHSAIINPENNVAFEMRSNDGGQGTVGTSVAAVPGEWMHIAQIRSDGTNGGAWGYVNGRAVASQSGLYDSSTLELAIGADAEDDTLGGTAFAPNFGGLVSDVEMFVFGGSFGEYDYTTDNGYFTDVFLPGQAGYSYADSNVDGHNDNVWIVGDINFDGVLNVGDVTAFVDGWRSSNTASIAGAGPDMGDYVTLGLGDLDLDGDTDVDDWIVLRSTGVTAGVGSLSDLLATGVPEPGSVVLVALGLAIVIANRGGWRQR